MNMARFQGPGVQRARGLIKLAQDIFLAGFEAPGRMGQNEEHWGRKSERLRLWSTEARKVLRLHCP